MAKPSFIVHGHFYQPPREDPRSGRVRVEPDAAPFHDWNEKINKECYRPNAFARIHDEKGRIVRIVNNFERMSFDIGPTLMSWLEFHSPDVYQRVIEGDRAGRGAMAMPFSHPILPLTSRRDALTQIRWGAFDFEFRFGRKPKGIWLPETAVNERVMALLAEEGFEFTILGAHQAADLRFPGGAWNQVVDEIDHGRGYRWIHPRTGGEVSIAFFDLAISHAIAFGDLTASSKTLLREVEQRSIRDFVLAAVDGETFGHHREFGEKMLAHVLFEGAPLFGIQITNLERVLQEECSLIEVRVRESSWSCAHGVRRWLDNCPCGSMGDSSNEWRRPLRQAFDHVRGVLDEVYERRASDLMEDPWRVRDDYIRVVLDQVTFEEFAREHKIRRSGDAELLLEAQRHSLLMYASCAWFFEDIARIEPVTMLRHAAQAMRILRHLGEDPSEERLVGILDRAVSNDRSAGRGSDIWIKRVLGELPEDDQPPAKQDKLFLNAVRDAIAARDSSVVDRTFSTFDGVSQDEIERAQELLYFALPASSANGLGSLAERLGLAPRTPLIG